MKKSTGIRLVAGMLSWLTAAFLFSCENPLLFNHCPDCFHEEPITSEIKARLSPSVQGMPTIINVYDGTLEDGVLLGTYHTLNTEWRGEVKLNKDYTVTATYYSYGTYYTGVDAVRPRVRYEKFLCTQPCFLIVDNQLSLKIKGL